MNNFHPNRRRFLQACVATAMGSSALSSAYGLLNVAQAAPVEVNDYKALVCIYLAGGNDAFNMLVPTEADAYANYASARETIAIPSEELVALDSEAYGFHPAAAGLASLFNQDQLSILANVGPLIKPTTQEDILNKTAELPPQLFSHNDQTRLWMTGDATGALETGWAGRIADQLQVYNNPDFPNVNFNYGEVNTFQTGNSSVQYGLNRFGVTLLQPEIDANGPRTMRRFVDLFELGKNHPHRFVREYARLQERSRSSGIKVAAALNQVPPLETEFTQFPGSGFSDSLATTVRMIAARDQLGAKRQIFFIVRGGWDTHATQADAHQNLLSELSTGLTEFHTALEEIGITKEVTTYTASDFGRTLTGNGDGTDHGWGGHALMMGGAVNGGQIFGTMPELRVGSLDDGGKGRIIPTTATEQYAATLARWFGIGDIALDAMFPNLTNFATKDLGFFV